MSPRTPQRLCIALTLVALAARLFGLGFGLPVWEEPDPDIAGHVDMLREGWTVAAVEEPDEQYPHVVADLARWLPERPPASGAGAPSDLPGHLRAAAWTHLQVRALVALVATLLVPLTFLLARRFLRPGWALFAAALVATSLLHQSFAQQARPHAFATTLIAAVLLADLALVRSGSWRAYWLAGALSALALGSLHNALAVLLAGLAAHALRGGQARFFDRKLLVPLALCAAALPLFYPFLFEHAGQPRDVEGGEVRLAEHAVSLAQFYGRGFGVLAQVLWNYEPVLALLLGVALLAAIALRGGERVERRDVWVVLAFALPYLVAIGLFERTYERFALPLLPCAAVFAAWGLQRVGERCGARATAAVALLALTFPAAASAKLAWLRARPDTLDLAAQWLEARPEATRETVYLSAAAPALDLPLFRRPEGLLFYGKQPRLPLSPWSAWQARIPAGAAPGPLYDLRWLVAPRGPAASGDLGSYLQSLAPALFVVEVYEQRSQHALQVRLRQALQLRGTRLVRFSPDPDPEQTELELFFQLSDHFNDDEQVRWPHFSARLLRAHAIGPVLEVWKVAPADG